MKQTFQLPGTIIAFNRTNEKSNFTGVKSAYTFYYNIDLINPPTPTERPFVANARYHY